MAGSCETTLATASIEQSGLAEIFRICDTAGENPLSSAEEPIWSSRAERVMSGLSVLRAAEGSWAVIAAGAGAAVPLGAPTRAVGPAAACPSLPGFGPSGLRSPGAPAGALDASSPLTVVRM